MSTKPRIEIDDMYDDVPSTPELTRKSKPVKGSLGAYTGDYLKLGFTYNQSRALGQLAFGQDRIRKRLDAIEAIELARTFGMVSIGGDHHLLECSKRDDKEADCTCGAVPSGAKKEG